MTHQIRVAFDIEGASVVKANVWSVPRVGDVVKFVDGLSVKNRSYRVIRIEHEVYPQEEIHRITVFVIPTF